MRKSEYSQCSNMRDMIDFAAEKYGEQDAFRWKVKKEIQAKKYRELKADSENISNVLNKLGLVGKNVAVIGATSYEWVISFFGIVNSGSVAVPLDVQLPAAEICDLLNRAHVSCFIYDSIRKDAAELAKKLCSKIDYFICMQKEESDENNSLYDLMKQHSGSFRCDEIDNEKLCTIIFTSGTTGKSKGVMLTHLNFADNATCFESDVKENGVALSVLPIHHAYCLSMDILKTLYAGATICINDSLMHIGKNLQLFQPTHILVVPMILEGLYKKLQAISQKMPKEEAVKAIFGSNLKFIYSGGAYLRQEYVDEMAKYGITVLQGYGMTECSPVISTNGVEEHKADSVGKLIPNCQAKIVDEEIWVKGSSVMMGYLDMPEETAETLVDGWLRTGDIGYVDEEGFIFITGRKKNLIIMANGENISPEEIENVLNVDDLVKEIIVSGQDNNLIAEIFPDYDYAQMRGIENISEELQKLIDDYNKDKPQYRKVTKLIIRTEEFEKTPSKKIKRKPAQV